MSVPTKDDHSRHQNRDQEIARMHWSVTKVDQSVSSVRNLSDWSNPDAYG